MDEEKLKKILDRLDKECEGMTDFEKETYYRAHLMDHFSVGVVDTENKR